MINLRHWFFPYNAYTLDILEVIRRTDGISTVDVWRGISVNKDLPEKPIGRVISCLNRLKAKGYVKSYTKPFNNFMGSDFYYEAFDLKDKGKALLEKMRPVPWQFVEWSIGADKVRKDPES